MRYLVLLSSLGQHWQSMMRAEGVAEETIESWGVYYGELCRHAGTCKPTDLHGVSQKLVSSFKTALWYISKARES